MILDLAVIIQYTDKHTHTHHDSGIYPNETCDLRGYCTKSEQESLAVASIARDDPSTLPGDDPFPRAH